MDIFRRRSVWEGLLGRQHGHWRVDGYEGGMLLQLCWKFTLAQKVFAYCNMFYISAATVLSSLTLHMYRGQFDWRNLVFINIYEAGETNLFPMIFNLNDVILGSSNLNRNQRTCFEW